MKQKMNLIIYAYAAGVAYLLYYSLIVMATFVNDNIDFGFLSIFIWSEDLVWLTAIAVLATTPFVIKNIINGKKDESHQPQQGKRLMMIVLATIGASLSILFSFWLIFLLVTLSGD